ncbi:ferritin-like domain-containing protein [Streptomyces sp. NPDC050560]|uniref:ferritin-like domain-containing protein n=1 Tax=Streptomyces sp. NPDC050560 TaxID=3365630 RepID=UPI0037AEB585
MGAGGFAAWTARFEEERGRRAALGAPAWERGAALPGPVWDSVRRFQVGEAGDGANLIAKADAAGDAGYAAAVRLFVAEENHHAGLLAGLLAAGGEPLLASHWSDRVFVRLRRLLGLRLELLVLMIAEMVALAYYRVLRDGTDDALTSEVAARILADEHRHVPFHCARLHQGMAPLPRPVRRPLLWTWRTALLAVAWVIALDHGPALRRLGTTRRMFIREVVAPSRRVTASIITGAPLTPEPNATASAPR